METNYRLDKQVQEELELLRDHFVLSHRLHRGRVSVEDFENFKGLEGGGLDDYFREYNQQDGDGAGDIFRGLYRAFEPVLKPVGKYLMRKAMRTGVSALSDMAQGEHWKAAMKRRLGEAGDDIVDDVRGKLSKMGGGGYDEGYDDYDHEYADSVDEAYRNRDKREEAERQLFSLRPPPVREGRVSALAKKLQNKKKKKTSVKKKKTEVRSKKKRRTAVGKKKKGTKSRHHHHHHHQHQGGKGGGGDGFYDE
jgi:hypothetical protein